jgi:SAM-dependent methyltransferase
MQRSSSVAGKTKFALLLVAAIGCLGVGAAARFTLYRWANSTPVQLPPPDRPGINAPFITTPDDVVDAMLDMAEIQADDVVYDLGCGDGRLVITAAVRFGCRGIGFDIDPQRVEEARANAREQGVEHLVQIEQRDVFTIDLKEADVVLMYLLPWMLKKLKPQLEEMPSGSRIVTHDFWIEGVRPQDRIDVVVDPLEHPPMVFLYRSPLLYDPAVTSGQGPPKPL